MKKLFLAVTVLTMSLSTASVFAGSHHGGGHHRAKTRKVCYYDDCALAGTHYHNGICYSSNYNCYYR